MKRMVVSIFLFSLLALADCQSAYSKTTETSGQHQRDVLANRVEGARELTSLPNVPSTWDDMLEGVSSLSEWQKRKEDYRRRFLELLRDDYKPAPVPLDLQIHQSVDVEGIYTRSLISYNVEADERAHAFLAIPHHHPEPLPAVVTLHGTYPHGKELLAGLEDNPEKALLDHLARRGYVVIAPDHFVAGHRIPPEKPYDTTRFYAKHPHWTAVGKFTYEHSIAVNVLLTLPEVAPDRIGVTGHSLGGQGAIFLAAYDTRIAACACSCTAPPFRHNPRLLDWARDKWYSYFRYLRSDFKAGVLPPIDFHQIIALIAPRPFLDVAAINDGDPRVQRQRVLMNLKIMDAYILENALPKVAFYVHSRGHYIPYDARNLIYAWLDLHLKNPSDIACHLVDQPPK